MLYPVTVRTQDDALLNFLLQPLDRKRDVESVSQAEILARRICVVKVQCYWVRKPALSTRQPPLVVIQPSPGFRSPRRPPEVLLLELIVLVAVVPLAPPPSTAV